MKIIEELKRTCGKKNRIEVKISKIKGAGLGLFSKYNSTRYEGEEGEILTRFDFMEEALDKKKLEKEKRYSLMMNDDRIYYMRTRTRKCDKLGVYANEARGKQKPNCYVSARYWRKGIPTAQLRVLTKVKKGDELLWDYGDIFKDT